MNRVITGALALLISTGAAAQSDAAIWARIEADNALRDAQRVQARREAKVDRIARERDRELAELREAGSHARDTWAGALYQQSLAEEKRATIDHYNAKLAREQRRIDRLDRQIDRVRQAR